VLAAVRHGVWAAESAKREIVGTLDEAVEMPAAMVPVFQALPVQRRRGTVPPEFPFFRSL
jgi:hypothetical protein